MRSRIFLAFVGLFVVTGVVVGFVLTDGRQKESTDTTGMICVSRLALPEELPRVPIIDLYGKRGVLGPVVAASLVLTGDEACFKTKEPHKPEEFERVSIEGASFYLPEMTKRRPITSAH